MAETVVVDGGEDEEKSPEEQAAYVAAAAAGATSVEAEQAKEAAEEAKAAAETALNAAQSNIENSASVIEAGEKAESSARGAAVSADMVHEALLAQTRAIETLTEELKASRKSAAPPADRPRKNPEEKSPGGKSGPRWRRA